MDAHDELTALADEYWDGMMAAFPSSATLLGDHRFDDRIEDHSAEAEDGLRASWSDLVRRADGLAAADGGGGGGDGLSAEDRVTLSLLRNELATGVAGLELRLAELRSDQMDGVHAEYLTAAPELNAPTPESARALVDRHRQVGRALDQAVERFRAGLAAGRTPARLVIERSIRQLDGYLATDLSDDPYVTFDGPPVGDPGWDAAAEEAWRDDLAAAARDHVRPGYQRYRDALQEELLPAARPDDRCGVSWLGDDGAEIYRTLIRQHTTLDDLGADEIHDIGLAEVERLRDEYATVGERLFGTTDVDDVFRRLRDDPALRYATGDEVMADARTLVDAATARMGDWFGRLPQEPCTIEAVPDFLAPDAPSAYYWPPAADGSRPGAYYVNQHEPSDRTRYEMAATAFHEAIPGHHLQLTIANELDHLPRFQRLSWGNTAFVEGWALYTERLADEMGLYRDDMDRIGMLAADSWRSCRLVVDTGLHARGWSRQRAVDYMVANAPVGLEEIAVEVDRYVAIPGQALGYKVGQLEIQRLRAAAEARGGFDIKAFHDRALGSGSVSLPVLRELVG
jgi:uncharacterized protein (DUF885 family)